MMNFKSNRKYSGTTIKLLTCLAVLCSILLCSCSIETKKKKVSVIIVPKFEVDEISGDFPGEAQLFYEKYCPGSKEIKLENSPPTSKLFFNEDSGVAILITGSGKTAAGLSLMRFLSEDDYDFSDAYIVSVGCAGGNTDLMTFGDVVLITAVCDYDLGHHVDAHEKEEIDSYNMWFPDESFDIYEWDFLNEELCEKTFQLIKDIPVNTTEKSLKVLNQNFPDRDKEELYPDISKGTAITSDSYWKGIYGHHTAVSIAEYYSCPDPYMVTEMEEMAITNTANCFNMLDRIISLRVVVNMDTFLDGETPENSWIPHNIYSDKVTEDNSETADIFKTAMHNLFDVGTVVVDAILDGRLK